MKFRECMIAWTPAYDASGMAGQIEVGPWPDETGWSKKYSLTAAPALHGAFEASHWQEVAQIFVNFHSAVVRDGVSLVTAHAAFLAIEEYRHSISPDIKGSEDPK
jgi:hypothetical protein